MKTRIYAAPAVKGLTKWDRGIYMVQVNVVICTLFNIEFQKCNFQYHHVSAFRTFQI